MADANGRTGSGKEITTLGGGCFWCLEAAYDQLKGVESVESGYMGGQVQNPTYEAVCMGNTGHAEVVQVTFLPDIISYRELLEIFFAIHDPTTLNQQRQRCGHSISIRNFLSFSGTENDRRRGHCNVYQGRNL